MVPMSHHVGKEIGEPTSTFQECASRTAGSLSGLVRSAPPANRVLMGDRSRSLSSSGLRLLLRLVSAVAALVVLSVTQRASATALVGTVPMCGEHNETIAAPPIFRVVDEGTISSAPCQGPEQLATGQGAPLAPERVIVYERPERVLGFSSLFIAQSESARVPVQSATAALERPGFVVTPFRPPRA